MWKITDGILNFELNGKVYYPLSHDILIANEKGVFVVDNQSFEAPNSRDLLRFSKLTVDATIEFGISKESIYLKIFGIRKNKNEIKRIDDKFLDYIIEDNVWCCLSPSFSIIIDLINKYEINDLNHLTYFQYMSLLKETKENYLKVIDNVLEGLKTNPLSSSIYKDKNLCANLFPYQKDGANWISFMRDNGCGCILADEMGLGKTLQIITVLSRAIEQKQDEHYLIVAPVSLLENWRREFEKFYPLMKVLVHHGSRRTGSYLNLLKYNVVVTSYSNIQNDLSMFNMINWDVVALDEAQNIKNPYAQRTKLLKRINKKIGVAITGTPFENHMSDLWSIVDFVIPGYLGTLSAYENNFSDSVLGAEKIEEVITPIMIRRKVADVAKDLPEKVEIPEVITMTEEEASFYENNRKNYSSTENLKQTRIDKIQGLRMFCTHPLVYNKELICSDPTLISNKYQRLVDILEEIFTNNEKAIIFTSFNEMINIMVKDINGRFAAYVNFINGSTPIPNRQKIIDEFSSIDGAGVLILNPKAAGTGLNITTANHVIHYNLEWNPALEDQASARSYRRGQNKTVFVHRLFYADTIEEVINERIQRKREMSNLAVVGTDGVDYDKDDLLRALSLSPIRE